MGAEHSQQTQQSSPRKTETANFDFRYDGPTLERDHPQTGLEGKESDKNYFWLEVGLDAVKKMEDRKL